MSNKRRTFTTTFKAEVVLQLLSGVKTHSEFCREHEFALQLLLQWKQTLQQNGGVCFCRRRIPPAQRPFTLPN